MAIAHYELCLIYSVTLAEHINVLIETMSDPHGLPIIATHEKSG